MGQPLILTFDCGTQSLRCTLIDKKGNILGIENFRCKPYLSVKRGYIEQYAQVYQEGLCEVAQKLKKNYGHLWKDIVAVTSTSVRDTCVCMDKDGNAVRPVISWMDQREAKFDMKKNLPWYQRFLFMLVGMSETARLQGKLTMSNWIRENEPENWEKTYKYMMFSGFITHFMTGKFVDSKANQIGHIPYHYKKRRWKTPRDIQYKIFNVEPEKLCDLVEPGEVLGYVTKEFAEKSGVPEGLPVIATGADKGCELLGCGIVDENTVSLSFGTQSTVQFLTEKYVEPEHFLPAYTAVMPNRYNPEIQIYRGYWMVSWFTQEFAKYEVEEAEKKGVSVEKLLDDHLKEIPPGCDGLMLQPLWAPMLKSPEGRGTIIGFNHVHTKWHLYRAIIEGINYALLDAFKKIQKKVGKTVKKLIVSGGGSQSDYVCQMTADMFGLPVVRVQTCETSSLGSAIAAFVSLGEFNDYTDAVKNMVSYRDSFEPNAKIHKYYDEIYNGVYKNLYKKLRPAYLNLKNIVWDKREL